MVGDVYQLKDKNGFVRAEFTIAEESDHSIIGTCQTVVGWINKKKPVEYQFFAKVYFKWDACTHWWFYGANYDSEVSNKPDGYYHLCGPIDTVNHITTMCFLWKLIPTLIKDAESDWYTKDKDLNKIIDLALTDYTIDKKEASLI